MKRFIFICVALIATITASARGGTDNYHQSDQLATHLIVGPQTSQVLFMLETPAVPAYSSTIFVNNVVETFPFVNKTILPDAFAYIDPGSKLNWKVNMNYNLTNLGNVKPVPIANNRSIKVNYNTQNYSYGLRF